ncbi:GIY-YIG nuclease family protein [Sporomusa malonica]|uniref:Group I intron endonuclease n=1 Tax=Sporomusa malonica TaxID=112901 RepID=A0A1W1ZTL1_9FIRM|nr:GIY-YIG nuclease family protein [Sporomusa malonica]SMC51592.1 hypothetical protein SAMN04488500_104178 [Sporomusa malonica]
MDKRKELKLAYKQTPRPMGVYQIKNQVNGKVFICGSMNLPAFFNSQRFQLNLKSHRNKELQADWDLYGADAFTFDILETVNTEKVAQDDWRKTVSTLEEKWLNDLQPYGDKGYHKQSALAK